MRRRQRDKSFCFFFQKEALSFLKKRNKKLLIIERGAHRASIRCGEKMLILSFAVLTAAAALGALLVVLVMREGGARPAWWVGAVHGVLGALGLLILFLALRGPPRGAVDGTSLFGWDAAGLLAVALLAGIGVLVRRRRPGLLLALHAILAVFGYVILFTYVSL